MTDFERLLEFYSTRKKELGLDLSDTSMLLQFESYFELKAANFFLMKILVQSGEDDDWISEFYNYMIDDSRKQVFGEAVVAEFVQSANKQKSATTKRSKNKQP